MDAGFTKQTIYINTPFAPIRFYTDSDFSEFSISPEMSDGMKFDTDIGVLTGIYTGAAKSVVYTVKAMYKGEEASTTFTIDYKGRICHSTLTKRASGKGKPAISDLLLSTICKLCGLFPQAHVRFRTCGNMYICESAS